MHESHMTEEMLQKVLERASQEGINKITRIGLALGSSSHVTPDSVRLHFEPLSKGTPAESAELVFRQIEGDQDFYLESIEGE